MTASLYYSALRNELMELGATLDAAERATPVPALPGWTVQDAYAHLAGICADAATGARVDPTDPAWPEGHVAARRDRPFPEVLAEWAEHAPVVEARLAATDGSGRGAPLAVFDVFHHNNDIRGALDRPRDREDETTLWIAATMAAWRARAWSQMQLPPIVLSTPNNRWELGEGDPTATLHTTDFELARMFVGRRSRAQMLAAGWEGDPEPIIDHLYVFGPAGEDLVE